MLQFYYHPLSPLARRVWLTLLEKNIEFEPIVVNLDRGEQLKPEFLAINPFRKVPAIVDGDFKLIESMAIMEYLEAKYPQPSLLPQQPEALAKIKMAQMVVSNELVSKVIPLILNDPQSIETAKAKRHLKRVCQFLTDLLGDKNYFGGNHLTLGDIVVGNSLVLIDLLDLDLTSFPQLQAYIYRLMKREAWQTVQPNREQIALWQKYITNLVAKKSHIQKRSQNFYNSKL